MQNSTKILIFSNCACVKPFQHKSEFGNILTLKTGNFFFAGVEYISEAFFLYKIITINLELFYHANDEGREDIRNLTSSHHDILQSFPFLKR